MVAILPSPAFPVTTRGRRTAVALAAVGALAMACLARPIRWDVEGLSMAPGVLPGEVVASGMFPGCDRWLPPRRFERWTLVAPDGSVALKRVVGLSGEEVGILDGDLWIDGVVSLKPPAVLAEVALPVAFVEHHVPDAGVRIEFADPVLDDVPFAPAERRQLAIVQDVGVTAVIDVPAPHAAAAPPTVEVEIGGTSIVVRFSAAGRHAVVAGRLDGAFVAAAWRLTNRVVDTRSCLPPGYPVDWAVQRPWETGEPIGACTISLPAEGALSTGLKFEHVLAWRDVHHLPPADGIDRWHVDDDGCFVLGDFPAGSRDSRVWGSIDVARLRHRVTPGGIR